MQAPRDDQCVEGHHRRDANYNQVFHISLALILLCKKRDFPLVRHGAVPRAAGARVPPDVAPATMGFGGTRKLHNRPFHPLNRHRFSKTFRCSVRDRDRMKVSFLEARNNDDRWRGTPHIERFQRRHGVRTRIHIEQDDGNLFEPVWNQLEQCARSARETHIEIEQRRGRTNDAGRVGISINEENDISFHSGFFVCPKLQVRPAARSTSLGFFYAKIAQSKNARFSPPKETR